ncbi:MAG: hypothetical protein ACYCUY_01360 [Acidithiobacillus sp.]
MANLQHIADRVFRHGCWNMCEKHQRRLTLKSNNLPNPGREHTPDREHPERLLLYWKSLLSFPPTGNAMVDAGFHEEMRSALRDALQCLQDLSRQLAMSTQINADLRWQRTGLMDRIDELKGRSTSGTRTEQHSDRPANEDFRR